MAAPKYKNAEIGKSPRFWRTAGGHQGKEAQLWLGKAALW